MPLMSEEPMQQIRNCQLCGKPENVRVYCGGPVAFMCDSCRDIVYRWEDRKKMRARIFKKRREAAKEAEPLPSIRETNEAKDAG